MYKITDNIIRETMKNEKVELTASGKNIATLKIQRGAF